MFGCDKLYFHLYYFCVKLHFVLLDITSLRAKANSASLEEQARRARKQQQQEEVRLSLEDFASFLNLPVTDTLTQVHSLFDKVITEICGSIIFFEPSQQVYLIYICLIC